jgi:hypothetical protein
MVANALPALEQSAQTNLLACCVILANTSSTQYAQTALVTWMQLSPNVPTVLESSILMTQKKNALFVPEPLAMTERPALHALSTNTLALSMLLARTAAVP